jgi:hypothetical protein
MKPWQQVDIEPVTIEGDQAIADGINAALARQLANNEPKCANCKHWDSDPKVPTLGACGFIVYRLQDHGVKELAQILAATLDLSVCSKWEAK